ncbi:MAG: sodium:proton exchanger [Pirellulaceae bacterium]|nr:sodium:proton exchanger [Pirellulaceae bacterium]
MDAFAVNQFIIDLLIVLAAGFVSGVICKRAGISLLVGYLVIGAIIGQGSLGLVSQTNHELEYLARAGALFLLFAVGLEFSIEELLRLSRYFLIGGAVQMLLVTLPLTVVCLLLGMTWKPALLAAAAGALSSTILVFKALAEWGQSATPHGRRAIGILLFQDVALVPLMLLVPLLTGGGESPTFTAFAILAGKSFLFILAVIALRRAIADWLVPLLAKLRSVELVVLFALTMLGGACLASSAIGLPPAVGALATGLMLSGNRLSEQIDTLILPYRESFAAVFFVTLGTLLDPAQFFEEPFLLAAGLVGMLALKSIAATVALKLIGLNWRAAAGMGIGLAQLGEFSFLLIADGVTRGIISVADYNRMLFIALGTLILTPQLIKLGLRWAGPAEPERKPGRYPSIAETKDISKALVIGIGPIGRQVASRLETLGVDVCLVDQSPINLHPFAQQGFCTVAGDARDSDVLHRVGLESCRLAVVCVRDDSSAQQIVRALRDGNPDVYIIVRVRFLANVASGRKMGADQVVSEEEEASGALISLCEQVVAASAVADDDGDEPTR